MQREIYVKNLGFWALALFCENGLLQGAYAAAGCLALVFAILVWRLGLIL